MAKPYASEMKQLIETLDWLCQADISGLIKSLKASSDLPMVAIGSGGSLSAAHGLATNHRQFAGRLSNVATPLEVVREPIDEQTANWSRDEAQDLMTNWMSSGEPFDFVLANNDEMAIGAIQAMKAAGMDMATVQVGGVDASQDALVVMAAGDYDVTVFQDSVGQGTGSIDAALKLAAGGKVDQKVYIPFKLVTPANMDEFMSAN